MDEVSYRLGVPGDAEEIARTMELAFEAYREFAPVTWSPPPTDLEPLRRRLADPAVWCQVAEAHGAMAGHVALIPAAMHSAYPDGDHSLAHLWQLFVREEHWGSGIATALHSAVVEEAARRGYSSFRLYAAAGQTRARRFYEREGWSAAGPPFLEEAFGGGMELVEYRRPLG
jgi:GNAT superfamily N-acetyltransferase